MAFLDVNNMPVNDRGEVWYGGQMVGAMPGGGGGGGGDFGGMPGGGSGRDQLAHAMVQRQMQQPMGDAFGPDQGRGFQNVAAGGGGGGGMMPVGGFGGAMNLNDMPTNDRGEIWHNGVMIGRTPGAGAGTSGFNVGSDEYLRSLGINPFGAGSSLSGGLIGPGIGETGIVTPSSGGFNMGGNQAGTGRADTMGRDMFSGGIPGHGPNETGRGNVIGWGGGGNMLSMAQTPISQGAWDPITGQPLDRVAIDRGPNPNAPGNAAQAGTTGQPGGYGDPGLGFTGFGGYSGYAGGGWGDSGFAGSGFNSSGDYSGGYDTAAGSVG